MLLGLQVVNEFEHWHQSPQWRTYIKYSGLVTIFTDSSGIGVVLFSPCLS